MNQNIEPDEKSREALSRVLRGVPQRRAPATLEQRVVKELERRAVLPWWRLGFGHWPMIARVAFVAICAAIIGLSILANPFGLAQSRAASEGFALATAWTHPASAVLVSAMDLTSVLMRVIPRDWAYGFFLAAAVLYAALFALGATAYRSLYRQTPVMNFQP